MRSVADATAEDTLDAVSTALPGWAATAPRERAECLRRAWSLMIAKSDSSPADGPGERQGPAGRPGRGDLRRRVLPLVRRGGGPGRGLGAHRPVLANRILVTRLPWVSARDHPVEFPGRDGDPQDRQSPGAGCTASSSPHLVTQHISIEKATKLTVLESYSGNCGPLNTCTEFTARELDFKLTGATCNHVTSSPK